MQTYKYGYESVISRVVSPTKIAFSIKRHPKSATVFSLLLSNEHLWTSLAWLQLCGSFLTCDLLLRMWCPHVSALRQLVHRDEDSRVIAWDVLVSALLYIVWNFIFQGKTLLSIDGSVTVLVKLGQTPGWQRRVVDLRATSCRSPSCWHRLHTLLHSTVNDTAGVVQLSPFN